MKNEKLLECIICEERFTLEDVRMQRFYASTLICHNCYAAGTGSKIWCFGDFDPKDETCRTHCPDAEICAYFQSLAKASVTTKSSDSSRQKVESAVSWSR